MKRRANKRTKGKKKGFGNNRYKTKPKVYAIAKGPAGIPLQMRTRIKWCNSITLQAASAVFQNNFRMNSLFDPDLTGTGTAAALLSSWGALYLSYRVYGVKVKITPCIRLSAATAAPSCYIAFCPSNTSAPSFNSASNVIAQAGSMYQTIVPGGTPKAMSRYYRIKDWSGEYITDVSLSALIGGNPATLLYGHLISQSVDGSTSTTTDAQVEFTFDVNFYGVKSLNQ